VLKRRIKILRKQTLAGLCFLLTLTMAYGLSFLVRRFGISVDLGPVSHIVYSAILTPLLLIPLARLNRPLLAWRKKRGRDIEEEEKHEIAGSDIISLWPKPSDDGKPS
jgi:hypothetical protein